jgi:hypothetical protein
MHTSPHVTMIRRRADDRTPANLWMVCAGKHRWAGNNPSVEVVMVHHGYQRAVYDYFLSGRTVSFASSKTAPET